MSTTSPRPGLTPPRRRGRRAGTVCDSLVELGLTTEEKVRAATAASRETGRPPEQVLLQTEAITADELARATADRFGLDHVDLSVLTPDLAAANLVTPQAARRYSAVPIGFADDVLLVAMVEPANVLALDDLKLITRHEVRPVVASSDDIAALIARMNRLGEAVADALVDESEHEGEALSAADIRESAEDAPIVKLVNSIVVQAVEDGASDIHFEPHGRDLRVRFRVDGVLSESTIIPRRMVAGVVSRVKIMGDLDIAERRLPQDGRLSLNVAGHALDIRIVTLPQVQGEGIVMRILDKEQVLLTLDNLGMRDEGRTRFERAIRQAHGAVLVTGPTGSGKSTTLYAALNAINGIEKNILTIEDPVEYQLPGINQVQVNPKVGLTFAQGLRSMLRADPDVIMVGEIRDAETARIAVESALTGHLVLSTLHTNDAPSALTRLTEMGIAPFLSASALDCVVAQRLARTLCPSCRQPVTLRADALVAAGFAVEADIEGFDPVGCGRCKGTGYRGRTGLYEVMRMSERLRGLAVERAPSAELRAVAVEEGMRLLRDDGVEKVRAGATSIAEVARVT